ncbi:MFS transporter [Kitasatospora camelliae]|uniref:MFS transporter n=1 Tax=Kitasatospora camelliae TaxID=3156397 RepID=A0AAU8JR30_9ACTN
MTTALRPTHSRRPAWAGRNFTLHTSATVISGLGNAAAPIATAFAVLEHGGGTSEVGYVTAARMVPLVLLLLIGGALADRLPRHRVMVGANLFNALSQAVLAALVLAGPVGLPPLLLLSAAGGAGQAFYGPAAQGVILQSVDAEHSARAFSVYRMAVNGAQIGGAALGGALVGLIGPGWVLALDAGCFVLAAALRTLLDLPAASEASPGEPGSSPAPDMLGELRAGWREFIGRRWLWAVVLQFSVVMACIEAVEAVYGPVVAKQRLGGAGAWGTAMAAFSVGMLAAGLLTARRQPRRILLVGNLGVFLFALPAVALAVAAPVPVLAAAMFVSGAGVTVFGVNWMLALQQEIPVELTSRVSAYDALGSLALTPVGLAAAGPAADLLGLDGALWACAATTLLLAAAVLVVPEVRRLSRATGDRPAVGDRAPAPAPALN